MSQSQPECASFVTNKNTKHPDAEKHLLFSFSLLDTLTEVPRRVVLVAVRSIDMEEADNDIRDDASDDWDTRKAFLSRIPATFDEDTLKLLFERKFGDGSVDNISILKSREDGTDETDGISRSDQRHTSKEPHRGFGFVMFSTETIRNEAVSAGTVRGGLKETSKRKHTIYVRPLDRNIEDDGDSAGTKNLCHLWSLFRCPYGDACKFVHQGEGGCLEKGNSKKKQKCFAFKKKGKCKLGDKCPFSHESAKEKSDTEKAKGALGSDRAKSSSEKDCINWKSKGKCRKMNKGCPYRHDEAVREAALAKKKRQTKRKRETASADGGEDIENRQPLSVRVFGMNYDTTEQDIREFFEHCGPIMEITFPTYEDSGRSKGYCGVLFQSPKAVAKAIELNEAELHGRWLSVQAGKMYLKQWEENERKQHSTSTEIESEQAVTVGEFGQRVKKRKKHGYKE